MKPFTKEYVDFAEAEWEAVQVLLQTADPQRFAAHIAFHCHQTADRYLKAWLIEHDIRPRKSGDLSKTLRLLKGETERWRDMLDSLDRLSAFEVANDGLGFSVSEKDREWTRQVSSEIRSLIRQRLGLD